MPIGVVAEQYLAELATRAKRRTIQDARYALGALQRDLGVATVGELRKPALMAWRHAQIAAGLSHKTVNTRLGYLKAALNFAVELEQLDRSPLDGLRGLPTGARHQRRKPRALGEWELMRLLAAAAVSDQEARALPTSGPDARPPSLREPREEPSRRPFPQEPFLRALIATGARYGELAAATWGDVDLAAGTLTFRAETTKNASARTIPLDVELVSVLQRLPVLAARVTGRHPTQADRIFLTPRGKPLQSGTANFGKHLRGLFIRAGIAHRDARGVACTHALRHTFASRLARSGIPLPVAAALTGHKTMRVLAEIYTSVDIEGARVALARLPPLTACSAIDDRQSALNNARHAEHD